MIIVIGASWACGEWKSPDSIDIYAPLIEHKGLVQYIEESGKQVVNLAAPAMSNLQIIKRLTTWIDRNPDAKPERIFVFQSDYISDQAMSPEADYDEITNPYSLSGLWLSRFYRQLSNLSQQVGTNVTLIGGGVDTLWIDNIDKFYPGLEIGCQSLVNLITNGSHRVESPVFSWYDKHSLSTVKKIKAKITDDQMPVFLTMLDQAYERENLIFATTEYFWPDGCHPNRKGHRVLYDFLVAQGYLQ